MMSFGHMGGSGWWWSCWPKVTITDFLFWWQQNICAYL